MKLEFLKDAIFSRLETLTCFFNNNHVKDRYIHERRKGLQELVNERMK